MNNDNFTNAAHAEAWTRDQSSDRQAEWHRAFFVAGAEWARDHLAAQEISHEEVIAAALELYVRSHRSTGRQAPFETLDHEEQVSWVKDGRAVLSAARAVRRGEKDTP